MHANERGLFDNRMVRTKERSTIKRINEYNGLNWRTVSQQDRSFDIGDIQPDEQRIFYYDASWRIDLPPADRSSIMSGFSGMNGMKEGRIWIANRGYSTE